MNKHQSIRVIRVSKLAKPHLWSPNSKVMPIPDKENDINNYSSLIVNTQGILPRSSNYNSATETHSMADRKLNNSSFTDDTVQVSSTKSNTKQGKFIGGNKKNWSSGWIIGLSILGIFVLTVLIITIYTLVLFETRTATITTTSTAITITTTLSCTSQTYSQSFTNAILSTTAQCTAWTSFRATLNCSHYTLLRFYGSLDPIGISVTNSTVVNNIAAALLNSIAYGPTTSNGYAWTVTSPSCGGGVELGTGNVCTCVSDYALRPCITNPNWGGVNGSTCSAASQTLTVTFS